MNLKTIIFFLVAENLNDLLFPLKASERAAKRTCSENLAKCAALKMAVLAQQMAALPHEAFWPPSMPVFVKQIESSLLVSSICLAAVVDTNQSSFWPTPDASVKKCAQGLGYGNLRLSLYVPKLKAEKQSILLNFHDRWILSNFWLKSCNVCPKMCRRRAMFAPTCAAGWIRLVSGASLAAGPCSLGQLYPGAALCYWRFFGWLPMAGWVCGWQLC